MERYLEKRYRLVLKHFIFSWDIFVYRTFKGNITLFYMDAIDPAADDPDEQLASPSIGLISPLPLLT